MELWLWLFRFFCGSVCGCAVIIITCIKCKRRNAKSRDKKSSTFELRFDVIGSGERAVPHGIITNIREDWIPDGTQIVDCPSKGLFLLSNGDVYLNTEIFTYHKSVNWIYNRMKHPMIHVLFSSSVRRVASCPGFMTLFLMSDQKRVYFMPLNISFWSSWCSVMTATSQSNLNWDIEYTNETIEDICCGWLMWGLQFSNGSLLLDGKSDLIGNGYDTGGDVYMERDKLPLSQPALSLKMGGGTHAYPCWVKP